MKILIISTLKRKVAADSTAARSRVIFELARGLAQRGHQVSLLGTGDSSIPGVEIIPVIEKGWIDFPPAENKYFQETALPVRAVKTALTIHERFDIIHNHLFPEFITPLIDQQLKKPMLTTIHIEAGELIDDTFGLFPNSKFIGISESQRKLFKKTKLFKVIYNGVDTNFYAFKEKKTDYLLWLGRINSAKNRDGSYFDPKGVRWAIKLAQETGNRLLMSGAVHDQEAFAVDVKPHLNDKIKWIGPVSKEAALKREDVVKLMQDAKAFLMTVNWEEPFGLVMAEAGSCGTPVIGFDRGAVAEVLADGKTGFIVQPDQGLAGLKTALTKIDSLDPQTCRNYIEEKFSVNKMVENYEKVYRELLNIPQSETREASPV